MSREVKTMKVTIKQDQKGLLYTNGILSRILGAGTYHVFGKKKIEVSELRYRLAPQDCTLDAVMALPEAEKEIVTAEVADGTYSLHFVDGRITEVLRPGRYAYWKESGKHEFRSYEINTEELSTILPAPVISALPAELVNEINVREGYMGLLFCNGKLLRTIDSGRYFFWDAAGLFSVRTVPLRTQQVDVSGQNILSRDKVALRVNFVISYRITDAEKALMGFDNVQDRVYTEAQLVLREYIGKNKMDEILDNREDISTEMCKALRERCEQFYVEICSAGIKDIILPGEISAIMNSVLAAEKRAQANVIMRREEVASTRSLLNTAKLMEENATLRKLKELEYLERICQQVGSITVDGSRDLLAQLATVVSGGQQ